MHMRIVWGRLQPGQWDQFERKFNEVLASHQDIPGLRGRWLVRDTADPDTGFSVSLWDSEKAMADYEGGALHENTIRPALSPFFAGDYQTHHCEVRVKQEFGG